MASAGQLSRQVADLLRSDHAQRIDFHLGGLAIGPAEFRGLADAIDDGLVRIETRPAAELEDGAFGEYYAAADTSRHVEANTILLRDSLNLNESTGRAFAMHECVHAIVDMTRATQTRALAEEVAASLAESLYLYQEVGQRQYDRWTDQRATYYQECRSLVYQYFLDVPTTPGATVGHTNDPPIKARGVWLPPQLYHHAIDALKQGEYSELGWWQLSEADGIDRDLRRGASAQGCGCSSTRLALDAPISSRSADALLDDLASQLQRDFGRVSDGANEALRRTVDGVRQRAQDGLTELIDTRSSIGAATAGHDYDALLDAARDLARGATESAPPASPGGRTPPRDTNALLEEASALAFGAAEGEDRWGTAGWRLGEPLAHLEDLAAVAAERAAVQVAAPATWSSVQDAALAIAEDVARDATTQAAQLAPAGWGRQGGPLAGTFTMAGQPAVTAAQAALTAAHEAWRDYDWAGAQDAALDRSRRAASAEAFRTVSAFRSPSTWQTLGAALAGTPEVGPGAAGGFVQPPAAPDFSAGGALGSAMSRVVAENAFGAASSSVVPFLNAALQGGLGSMHSAAFDAASAGFARYDAGFDAPPPFAGGTAGAFGPQGPFGGVGTGLPPR